MNTPVNIKLDAEQLLLAEGVCRQLNIITYHPLVLREKSRKMKETMKPITGGNDQTGECRKSVGVQAAEETPSPQQPSGAEETTQQTLIDVKREQSCVLITNFTGYTQCLEEGDVVGQAVEANIVQNPATHCHPQLYIKGIHHDLAI